MACSYCGASPVTTKVLEDNEDGVQEEHDACPDCIKKFWS